MLSPPVAKIRVVRTRPLGGAGYDPYNNNGSQDSNDGTGDSDEGLVGIRKSHRPSSIVASVPGKQGKCNMDYA
jgi:hypothetical protein